ncbi:MAG: outer-membrane lipoprotein carrier protein LolA, partial [Alphaproteobacteria bacterium]|nr:outer-membrane lipoprotein carrier protein LolA [Alphaproteobacteria bacterium]
SIVYEDKKSNQISYISMNSNPASIILNGNITLTGKKPSVKIKKIEEGEKTTEITLTTANEKQSCVITLIFENKPLSLSGWRVRDAQGITTEVTLSEIKPESYFDPSLFKITRNKTIGTTKSKSKYY